MLICVCGEFIEPNADNSCRHECEECGFVFFASEWAMKERARRARVAAGEEAE